MKTRSGSASTANTRNRILRSISSRLPISKLRSEEADILFALVDARRHTHTRDTFQGLDAPRSTLNHIAFEIDRADYESEKERLERLGLGPKEMQFSRLEARALFFKDPEGNLLEFICHDP